MFEYILRLESNDLWTYGAAGSVQYPLAKIDTINQENGELNEYSALSLVTYGVNLSHKAYKRFHFRKVNSIWSYSTAYWKTFCKQNGRLLVEKGKNVFFETKS